MVLLPDANTTYAHIYLSCAVMQQTNAQMALHGSSHSTRPEHNHEKELYSSEQALKFELCSSIP